jgi:hypothetical protein
MSSGTPVRVGYDYHLAEVHVSELEVANGARHRVYTARCEACGWVGPDRSLAPGAAEDDATAHDIASNPPANR